jgi:hypothetical protein
MLTAPSRAYGGRSVMWQALRSPILRCYNADGNTVLVQV